MSSEDVSFFMFMLGAHIGVLATALFAGTRIGAAIDRKIADWIERL